MNNLQFQPKYLYKLNLNPQRTPTKDHIITLKRDQSLKKYRIQPKKSENGMINVQSQDKNSYKTYQIKISNMQAELEKTKTEYQRKINQLLKQKNYYKGLAQAYSNQNYGNNKNNHLRQNNTYQNRDRQNKIQFQKLQKSLSDMKNQIISKQNFIKEIQKENIHIKNKYNQSKDQIKALGIQRQFLVKQNSKLTNDILKLKNQMAVIKQMNLKYDKMQKQNRDNSNIMRKQSEQGQTRSSSRSNSKGRQDIQIFKNGTILIPHPNSNRPKSNNHSQSSHNINHNNGHHRNLNETNQKIKFLEHLLDKANRKIINLSKLLDSSNEQKVTNQLAGLNKKYQEKH